MAIHSLEIKELTKKIGSKTILDNIDLSIEKGMIIGLIGPNGAGKTTTFKCCSGLSSITSGDILINGHSIKRDFESAIKKLSYSYGSENLYPFYNACENIKSLLPLKDISKEDMKRTLSVVGLESVMNAKIKTYSLGMKQRLSLAMAFIGKPDIILLDEPFNGVDPQGVAEFRSIITKYRDDNESTFVISSHNLSEISKVIDSYVFMNHGRIVKNSIGLNTDEKIYTLELSEIRVVSDYLEQAGIGYKANENRITFMLKSFELNGLLQKLAAKNVVVYDISTESSLEKEYLELLGGEHIE